MKTISTTEIKSIVRRLWSTPGRVPVPFFHGPPGVSKSAQIAQACTEFSFKMHDIRLSQLSAMDVRGLPVIDRNANTTTWFTPDFLPSLDAVKKMQDEGYKGLVLFFDELSSAAQAIQAASYSIILDKKSGNYSIPEVEGFPIHMVAAGNNLKDGAVVNPLSTALKNRMVHFQVRPDADGFIAYGLNNDMDHRVISFIKSFPQHLHVMPPKGDPSVYSFPTNRTWEFVSTVVKDREYDDLSETIVAGLIGEGAAHEFHAHMHLTDKLPDLDRVINDGFRPDLDKTNMTLIWAFAVGITSKVLSKREKITDAQMDNYLAALQLLKPEFMVLGLDQIVQQEDRKLVAQRWATRPEFRKLLQKHLKVITG